MLAADQHAPAELIWSFHQPWKASVGECLRRWQLLDPRWRTQSWLVIHGDAGTRRTLGPDAIASLASIHEAFDVEGRRAA